MCTDRQDGIAYSCCIPMFKMRILLFSVSCAVLCVGVFGIHSVVNVIGGKLKGDWSETDGVTRFLGVPYALPPVGQRRFAPPHIIPRWDVEKDCTSYKPSCPQPLEMFNDSRTGYLKTYNVSLELPKINEDCLYLNIFVPGEVQFNKSLPVMVHFQDSGFQVALTDVFDVSGLAREGEVIVVTFSSRLGVLGFYGGHNLGLWDQIEVLKWIHRNIEAFGGDANRVTLFGVGSGAFAVGLHVLSAESRGLFKRAISQGTSAYDITLINSNPASANDAFNKAVNCELKEMEEQMKCLRSLKIEDILSVQVKLAHQYLNFMPAVDGKILQDTPAKILETMKFNDVDYMLGVNSNGGSASVFDFFSRLNTGADEDYFKAFLDGAAYMISPTNFAALKAALSYEYAPVMKDSMNSKKWFQKILDFSRDGYLSQVRVAQLTHAGAGLHVYAYYFDQSPPVSGDVSADVLGVPAGVEELFLFGHVRNEFSTRLMKTWATFAKTGMPVLELGDGTFLEWPNFNATHQKTAFLRSDVTKANAVMDSLPGNLERKISLWIELLPRIATKNEECRNDTSSAMEYDHPMVRLKQGHVLGRLRMAAGNQFPYEEYLDIPYAVPPVGDLRFHPPRPHQGWKGILNRTRETTGVKICPQTILALMPVLPFEVMEEDCLTLDIYLPYGVSKIRYRQLPVMVFIHGGEYVYGSKNSYFGNGLVQREVILVVINYRLGVLGFLATGDKASIGNYGLMDQHLALKWVKENIGHFGGDPGEVTIFGESAGAGSVMFQVIAPANRGLFKRAIAESGATECPWSLVTNETALVNAKRMAEKVNCSSISTHMMVNCLKRIDAMDVINAGGDFMSPISMNPVTDGHFIPKLPEQMYKDGVARNITVMMGRTRHEGYGSIDYPELVLARLRMEEKSPSLAKAVDFYYRDFFKAVQNGLTDWEDKLQLVDLETDYMFSYGIEKEANLHVSNGGKLYRFLFNFHAGVFYFYNSSTPDFIYGAHGEELAYVFGNACVRMPELDLMVKRAKVTKSDITMCHAMMDMWTNFAYTGHPLMGRRHFNLHWPQYTMDTPYIFNINENLTMSSGDDLVVTPHGNPELFRPKKIAFWNKLAPELRKIDIPKLCNASTTPMP